MQGNEGGVTQPTNRRDLNLSGNPKRGGDLKVCAMLRCANIPAEIVTCILNDQKTQSQNCLLRLYGNPKGAIGHGRQISTAAFWLIE